MSRRQICLLTVVALALIVIPADGSLRGQEKTAPVQDWEFKAVSFTQRDEKEATKMLNQLAASGWEYVGPLGNDLVAFKRRAVSTSAALVALARDGNIHIMLVDMQTGKMKKLTQGNNDNRFPVWSPDGRKIVFASTRDGGLNVFVMDSDGANLKQLTKDQAFNYNPCWSPDGKKIAFCRIQEGKGTETLIIDADGGNLKTIRDNAWDPHWSPDGKKIAITSWTEKGFKVCVMDPDGGNHTELATNDNAQGMVYPCWSPDSKKIAYTDLVGQDLELCVCDADGKNVTALTKLGGVNTYASWSPDGKTVYFQHRGADGMTYFAMNPDGTNQRALEFLSNEKTVDGGRLERKRP